MIWEATYEELDGLYGDGVTIEDLAARYHTSTYQVYKRMREVGLKPASRNKRLWSALSDEQFRELYEARGWSMLTIATRYGVTTGSVRQRMRKLSIAARPARRPKGSKNGG